MSLLLLSEIETHQSLQIYCFFPLMLNWKVEGQGERPHYTTINAGLVPFLVKPAGSCSNSITQRLANEGPRAPGRKLPLNSLELGNLQLLPLHMKQNKNKRFTVATHKGF